MMVLSFDYGQRHKKELECARWQAEQLGVQHTVIPMTEFTAAFGSSALIASSGVNVPNITEVLGDPQPVTYVPNRNMIFLSIAAAVAESVGADKVFYGAQLHDQYGYWDVTPEFVQAMNDVLSLNRKNQITIMAPFARMTKAQILGLGFRYGVDYSHTWSCYRGGETACGTCPTCSERLAAFSEHRVRDPLPYGG
jgi:7-cyano-7-deazaguanine synthase